MIWTDPQQRVKYFQPRLNGASAESKSGLKKCECYRFGGIFVVQQDKNDDKTL